MINTCMRLNELICENHIQHHKDKHSATDMSEFDRGWNPEAEMHADAERKRTKRMWKDANGSVPVVTEDETDPDAVKFTTKPIANELQSPGYRGEQDTRKYAGAPSKPYDTFDPNFTLPDYPVD